MLLLHLKFRCHHQADGKPRLQVVSSGAVACAGGFDGGSGGGGLTGDLGRVESRWWSVG